MSGGGAAEGPRVGRLGVPGLLCASEAPTVRGGDGLPAGEPSASSEVPQMARDGAPRRGGPRSTQLPPACRGSSWVEPAQGLAYWQECKMGRGQSGREDAGSRACGATGGCAAWAPRRPGARGLSSASARGSAPLGSPQQVDFDSGEIAGTLPPLPCTCVGSWQRWSGQWACDHQVDRSVGGRIDSWRAWSSECERCRRPG